MHFTSWPNHRFHFGDPVQIAGKEISGVVKAIRYTDKYVWYYQLEGLGDQWLSEKDLVDDPTVVIPED